MTGLGADKDEDDDEGRAVRFWWREQAVAMRSRSVLNAVDWEGNKTGQVLEALILPSETGFLINE